MELELVRQALDLVRVLQDPYSKPIFAKNNRVWKLADKAESVVENKEERLRQGNSVLASINGVEIVDNPELDRIQIFFPEKPSPEVITSLKRGGWNWSRSNGAWQRKATENAKESAASIVTRFYSNGEARMD